MTVVTWTRWWVCLLVFGVNAVAGAQTLPAEPLTFRDGLATIGGAVSASFGGDDPGFFNYTDYERSALRLFRADLNGSVRLGGRVKVIGELRSENLGRPEAYALYARIRPWRSRAVDIQVGRVPPTFGAFARRTYAGDNPLIGYPLAYQYLTSLRPDSVPATSAELLRMRGRGWRSNFSIGNVSPGRGVPLMSAFRWDTGVQVHAASDVVDATVSATMGTLSNPLLVDDNAGRQLAGRVAFHPVAGLLVGVSGARGPFWTATAAQAAAGKGGANAFTQTAWGADVEYSRGYYLIRVETILSRWTVPAGGAPAFSSPLRAAAASIEGRYKFRPGWYGAARVDRLGFSAVSGPAGPETWEAPVTRLEVAVGYSLQRNLLLKLAYQLNRRDTPRLSAVRLAATEISFWF